MSKREIDQEIDDLWVMARALNGKATGISDRKRVSEEASMIRYGMKIRVVMFFGLLAAIALLASVIVIFTE